MAICILVAGRSLALRKRYSFALVMLTPKPLRRSENPRSLRSVRFRANQYRHFYQNAGSVENAFILRLTAPAEA